MIGMTRPGRKCNKHRRVPDGQVKLVLIRCPQCPLPNSVRPGLQAELVHPGAPGLTSSEAARRSVSRSSSPVIGTGRACFRWPRDCGPRNCCRLPDAPLPRRAHVTRSDDEIGEADPLGAARPIAAPTLRPCGRSVHRRTPIVWKRRSALVRSALRSPRTTSIRVTSLQAGTSYTLRT
jgi:hypothetical protein